MHKITINLFFLIALSMMYGCTFKQAHPIKNTVPKKPLIPKVCFQPNAVPLEKALKKAGADMGSPVYIRIFKQEKLLELWVKSQKTYTLVKTYPICSSSGYLGPKQKSGDRQSPEGVYSVDKKSLNPNSHYHLALNIQYPNRLDRNHHRTGDLIMIHGKCSSVGCFAMGDTQIEEIYKIAQASLQKNQPFFYVAIYPFHMTEEKLKNLQTSHWYHFWLNLKTGYDMFEQTHIPPFVGVKGAHYVFEKRGDDLTQN